jgi:hypothetical protein
MMANKPRFTAADAEIRVVQFEAPEPTGDEICSCGHSRDAIQEAYEAMPLNKDRLYESLSTTAMDVYYDHQRAEEEAEEIAVRE